jgi:hypothetical protein
MLSVGCSTLLSRSGAKARTELGFLSFSIDLAGSGYLLRILVVLTDLAIALRPRVARCKKAMLASSADTRAVCRVLRKLRCRTVAPEM